MKIKEWCKNHPNRITFIVLCIFSSIIYMQFILGHYATDTYTISEVGYDTYIKSWYLTDGRIFSALFLFIIKIFNISIEWANTISILIAIVLSNLAVIQIVKWIERYVKISDFKGKIFLTLICYTIIWNFTYVENMYFLESSVMALSVLFYTMTAIKLVEEKKWNNLKALIFAILGVISYQGTIGFVFILIALMTFVKNPKNYKKNIIDIIKSGIVAGIAVVVDLEVINIAEKILGTNQRRLGSLANIIPNFKFIVAYTSDILKRTCNLYPDYLFIIFSIAIAIILLINLTKQKEKNNQYIIFVKMIILFVLGVFSGSVTYFLTLNGFWAGRLRFAIGSILGILFLYIAAQTNLFFGKNKEERMLQYATQTIFVIYFLTVIVCNVFCMYEHKQVNKLEEAECREILNYINRYEEETQSKVENIQVITIRDQVNKTYYSQVYDKNVLTYSGIRSDWSAVGCINFYTKKGLVQRNEDVPNEVFEKIINSDQEEICIGNTLYVKCYMY